MHYRLFVTVLIFFFVNNLFSQSNEKQIVSAGLIDQSISLDGLLDEQEWKSAGKISSFRMIEPDENSDPSFSTVVRIMVDKKNIYLGIICKDPNPDGIVAFSKARDSKLENEDYLKFVFDTYGDGRSAYIFSINPFGARYDALASNRGESEDSSWDGIWEAKTKLQSDGWTAEIRIPINSLTFRKGLKTWGFNVERRIQRLIEVDRWSAISRDYKLAQTIHAGQLNDLPDFNLGIGLMVKGSTILDISKSVENPGKVKWDNSLDITQIGRAHV